MKWLRRLFRPLAADAAATERQPRIGPVELPWRDDTSMPIVDWKAARQPMRGVEDAATLDDYWWSAAVAWLEALRAQLPDGFRVRTSPHFALLSNQPEPELRTTIEACERYRKAILWTLDGVARAWGHGPHVAIVFDTVDQYYDYIGNYYPREGVFAMSSGVFLNHGYGHFVFVSTQMWRMDPVIAHELTHCMLAPLPIPTWVNEGTAVNLEHQLVRQGDDPRDRAARLHERLAERGRYWNARTIQAFWSGEAFHLPEEGSKRAYDLAAELTRLIAQDYPRYRAFMNAAHRDDAGAAAAPATLGLPLGGLVEAVLGDGDWEPQPARWGQETSS